MAIAMVVMSACNDDDSPVLEPQPEDLVPFAMTYVDFITPDDVQILTADTTSISVSSAYAEKMGIKFFKDRAVTIWRTMGTVPFIRIITDAQENNGKIILTTKRGEFCDMFENLDASLVSDLHVNRDYVPSRTTRAGTDEEYTDISGKYMDNDGVYHPAVITPFDLKNILSGKSSEKLPIVLEAEDHDNVLLLWSGHGSPGALVWDENQKTITGEFMANLFNDMYSAGKYRKLFGIIEACYAGSVAAKCVGIPNLLLMTAANDKETSKAELYTPLWDTYLTNSFTQATLQTIQNMVYDDLSIRDLYSETFSNTMGSHVTLYNMENFGNVFFNYVDDYFCNLKR